MVVKIPINLNGIATNDWEGSLNRSSDIDGEESMAKTKMIYIKNIPIVFMEYVRIATEQEMKDKYGEIPLWVGFIDCGQVGFNKNNKLVAYDYG